MSYVEALLGGQYYHIYNRGNNQEVLFREERNYPYFLDLYAKYIQPVADAYAYCLLSNHFHLLIRIKEHDQHITSRAFSDLFSTYTKAFNKGYQRSGSLFEKPFKRKRVENDRYLCDLVVYIHQNPQMHGFVERFEDWPYSSYALLLSDEQNLLHADEVLGWFGGRAGFEEHHLRLGSGDEVDTIINTEGI